MFKKRRQNLRQRRRNDSDDENDGDNQQSGDASTAGKTPIWEVNIETVSKSLEEKQEPSVSKSCVLSFAEEEEAESEFKVKKSSRSERIARKLKKASRKEKEAELAAQKEIEEERRKDIYDYRPASPKEEVAAGSDIDSDLSDESGHRFRSVLDSGCIPDANMIHLARKRRQMARDAQDYIPVADKKRSAAHERSRLVREENDDDDEDDVVPFSQHVHHRERQRMRDEFLNAEHGSGESDSDKDNWETQQIKKAMDMPQLQATAGAKHVVESYLPVTRTASPGAILQAYQGVQETETLPPASLLSAKQTVDNCDDFCKRLNECLQEMKQVGRVHENEYEKCKNDLDENEKLIEKCQTSIPVLERKYRFFQQMRGYVKDLVLCHNEKLPLIEDLEKRYLQLLQERSAMLLKRRQQDVKDQVADYNPMKEQKTNPPVDTPRQRRAAEREARKGRRRRAREAINIIGHYDGLSTDDEQTQSDLARYNMEKQKIYEERDAIYEDVLDEFCKIPKLSAQFEEWKFDQSDSYKDAYIALCLPKLFSPLVKLELIDWNPLDPACSSLERHGWYTQLVQYGRSENIDPDDLDLKITPSIIEKYVVPKLTVLAETVWDPLSKRETLLFVSLIERIGTDYPLTEESKNLQLLLKSIVNRINRCIDDDIFLPLYPKHVHENKFSLAAVFFSRQVWTCIKLFRNTLMWHKVICPDVLKQMAFEALLNRYIILGLSNCLNNQLIQRCQVIADAIPNSWFCDATEDSTFPELDKFCRFLVNVGLNLDRLLPTLAKNESESSETKRILQSVKKLLVNLHAMDHAMDLAQNCSANLDK